MRPGIAHIKSGFENGVLCERSQVNIPIAVTCDKASILILGIVTSAYERRQKELVSKDCLV